MPQNFLTSTMRHWPSCWTSTHPGSRLSPWLELRRRGTTLSAVSQRQRQGSWRRPTDGDAQLSRNMRGEYSSVSNVHSSSRSTSTIGHVPSTRVTATRRLCGQSCECCCSLSRAAVHAWLLMSTHATSRQRSTVFVHWRQRHRHPTLSTALSLSRWSTCDRRPPTKCRPSWSVDKLCGQSAEDAHIFHIFLFLNALMIDYASTASRVNLGLFHSLMTCKLKKFCLTVARPTQPPIPLRSVNDYQLRLGRQRQIICFCSVSGWTRGVPVKSVIPWERVSYLSALEVCSRQGAIQIHAYITLSYLTVWTVSTNVLWVFW